jgi:predicted kinase
MTAWEELARADLDQLLAWAEAQPWARAMAECQQDAEWHSEGDVWTHTKMVCRQLPEINEWASLSQHERMILIFTALFHDAGKPETSRFDPGTGRIQSPKHTIRGEHLARHVLRDLDCDIAAREEIAQLVRYHGRPAFLMERSSPQHEVISLSWLVSNQLLYLFALADTRGRATSSMSRPEESLHYWKLMAEESSCFDSPYPFANAQARFQFYRQANADLHYVPHEEYRCKVTLMSGLPGGGKDTWLAKNRPDLPVVSLDDIRGQLDVEATDNQGQVVQEAKEQCRELLRTGRSFAFSATNLIRQTRKRWIDLFADYKARVEAVYVEPRFETILSQNKQRQRPVPENVIRELADRVEPPNWTEAHDLVLSP